MAKASRNAADEQFDISGACAACVDACNGVMDAVHKPHGLIGYSSSNHEAGRGFRVLRPRTLGYGALWLAACAGFIALVAPLVRAGLIAPDHPLSCNAVSGYSGGGKAMIAEFESGAAATAWRTYALTLAHKHVPEMQVRCELTASPLFAPSVANVYRGMIVDVPLPHCDAAAIRDALGAAYARSPLVALRKFDEASLTVEHAADSDRLDLFVFANAAGTQARLVAALDNLGKGASGAAVQSLNLMSGLPETAGLRL